MQAFCGERLNNRAFAAQVPRRSTKPSKEKTPVKIMIVGASKGLGRAFVEGLCRPGDTVIGVSRKRPDAVTLPDAVDLQWIEADMASPADAVAQIARAAPKH